MLFLVPIKDYLFTLTWRNFIFEILMPVSVALVLSKFLTPEAAASGISELRGAIINLLAIFVGFSITALTSLVSSNGGSIKKARDRKTDHKIGNQNVSLFQYIHLTLSYSIVIQILLLLFNILILCSRWDNISKRVCLWVVLINAFLLLHVFAVNLRNVSYIYFLFWAPADEVPEKPKSSG
jgi:hypothetical protein